MTCHDFVCVRYEKSSRFMKEGYERDFLRYLQSLLAEVERRIRRGHARLALSQAQQNAGVSTQSPVHSKTSSHCACISNGRVTNMHQYIKCILIVCARYEVQEFWCVR